MKKAEDTNTYPINPTPRSIFSAPPATVNSTPTPISIPNVPDKINITPVDIESKLYWTDNNKS